MGMKLSIIKTMTSLVAEYTSVLLVFIYVTCNLLAIYASLSTANHSIGKCTNSSMVSVFDIVSWSYGGFSIFIGCVALVFLVFAFGFYCHSLWTAGRSLAQNATRRLMDESRTKFAEHLVIEFVGNLILIFMADFFDNKHNIEKRFGEVQKACAGDSNEKFVNIVFQANRVFAVVADFITYGFVIVGIVFCVFGLIQYCRKRKPDENDQIVVLRGAYPDDDLEEGKRDLV